MSEHREGCEEVHWDCRIAQLKPKTVYTVTMYRSPDCPITLHRALIAELEKETEK